MPRQQPSSGHAAARRGGSRRAPAQQSGSRRAPARRGHGGRPPGKKRFIDYPRHNKYSWRRWMPSWKLVTALCLTLCGSLMGAAAIAYAMVGTPKQDLSARQENNVFYWADGSQMAATGGEVNRQIVGIEQIPQAMQNAVVSAENKTFWTDSGVDPMGIGRAVWNMVKGGETQGGSTITQQYVKNNRLNDQSQTLTRKVKELFISMRVGNDLEKPVIMAGYLNTSYYGRGAYGIQAASRTYFGNNAADLDPSQSAFLASLLKGSTYYDPAGSPEIDPQASPQANRARAEKRWKWILDEMVKDGNLPAAERAKYTKFPKMRGRTQSAQVSGQIGYLVRTAEANFLNSSDKNISAQQLAKGGFEIHTTFDKKKVGSLEKAIKTVYDEHIDPKKRPKEDTHVQFGGASVDPKTGEIVALYGGTDATKHFTNNADQTGAQVGSTFKPFVLAAAMRDGVRKESLGPEQGPSSRTLVDPDKSTYNGQNKLKIRDYDGSIWRDERGKEWLQVNDDNKTYRNMTLREAMERSVNSPYVQLGMDVGIEKVRRAAVDAGLLKSSLSGENVPTFSLGISSPSAIRMAAAYSTFANNGEQNEPFSVTKVLQKGEVVYQHAAAPKRAFSTAVASNVTDVLKDVVKKGTGKKAALDDRDTAGKTGTTDGNNSAWFVGYTPQLSTAIDMYRFADDETIKNRKFEAMFGTGAQPKIHGSSFPSQIWHDYMTEALNGTEPVDFPAPEDLGAEAVFGGGAVSPTPTPTGTETATAPPTETQSDTPSSTTSSLTPTVESAEPTNPDKTCQGRNRTCDSSEGASATSPPGLSGTSPSTDVSIPGTAIPALPTATEVPLTE
ncbi:transglycosylase domain-containing protein [Streptomyces rubiginosohelvolus]|uniref:transglycosylase domain-containing protein n=1 Tax=Streptomyces rubiginosohelvolus TaxID=67362 RepID=UPI0034470BBA